jgi:hypothetical protein
MNFQALCDFIQLDSFGIFDFVMLCEDFEKPVERGLPIVNPTPQSLGEHFPD